MKRFVIVISFIIGPLLSMASTTLEGDWRINFLLGIDSVNEYVLTPPDSGSPHIYGNALHLMEDGTFYSNYSAPCGLDCFRTSYGTYSWIDPTHIRFQLNRKTSHGTCGVSKDSTEVDLGVFLVVKTDEGIRLIKSDLDRKNDKKKVAHSDYINAYLADQNQGFQMEQTVNNTQLLADQKAIIIACLSDSQVKPSDIKILYSKRIGGGYSQQTILLFKYKGGKKMVLLYPTSQSAGLLL